MLSPLCLRDFAKSLLPIVGWLPQYSVQTLRQDAVAGITVGLMVIPQGLAYAQVAELPVQYGLYSAFMGPFVYCLLGTSKDTTLGPTAIMSLITATYNLAPGPAPKSPVYAVLMCFTSGLVQLACGLLRLGSLVDFISLPVIGAFTTSAAVTIAWGQVKLLLGLKDVSNSLPKSVYQIVGRIAQTNLWDLVLGLSCMAVLMAFMKFQRDVTVQPGEDGHGQGERSSVGCCVKLSRAFVKLIGSCRNALVVSSAGLTAYALKSVNVNRLSMTPSVESGLPEFKPPDFQLNNGTHVERNFWGIASDIGIGFAVVPFIGLVETIAISKVFARRGNYKIDASQELIAIGVSNIVGSFVSSYPVTGSFARTVINHQSGVRTPAGGIFTGAVVLLALALLGDLFRFIPQAALAAVIIVAVLQMTDFRMIPRLWRISRTGLVEWLATFVLALLVGLEVGIVVGIATSFLFLLYAYKTPEWDTTTRPSGLSVLTLKSAVRFPASGGLQAMAVKAVVGSALCIDLTIVPVIDFSVVDALLAIQDTLRLRGKPLYILAGSPSMCSALQQAGLQTQASLEQAEGDLIRSQVATEITPLLS